MAKDSISIKLRAEGEAEFRKALSDLNAQFKLIKSSLNLVSSEYDQNDKSAQAVAARSKVLTEQMEAQKSKIELLEKALASATTAYGESDKRTLAYATSSITLRRSLTISIPLWSPTSPRWKTRLSLPQRPRTRAKRWMII